MVGITYGKKYVQSYEMKIISGKKYLISMLLGMPRLNLLFDFLDMGQKSAGEKIAAVREGKIAPRVSYEESDQSPVCGLEAAFMGHEHITFKMCDYDPFQCRHLSDWVKTLFCGDYEKFLEFLQGLSEKEVKRLISKRESLLNVSAVFHVISGAHRLYSDHPDLLGYQYFCSRNEDVKYDHMKILIKLVSLGVDVNARDIAGQTPLNYCTNNLGNNSILIKMAEHLIRAGADVNGKDRKGYTPLLPLVCIMDPTGSSPILQLLIDHGADPYIKSNDGHTPWDLSSPSIRDVFGAKPKVREKAKKERRLIKKAAGGSLNKCIVCRSVSRDNKRCGGKLCNLTIDSIL